MHGPMMTKSKVYASGVSAQMLPRTNARGSIDRRASMSNSSTASSLFTHTTTFFSAEYESFSVYRNPTTHILYINEQRTPGILPIEKEQVGLSFDDSFFLEVWKIVRRRPSSENSVQNLRFLSANK
jgi:hypothetical protein